MFGACQQTLDGKVAQRVEEVEFFSILQNTRKGNLHIINYPCQLNARQVVSVLRIK